MRCCKQVGEEFHNPGAFFWSAITHVAAVVRRWPACLAAWLFFYKKPGARRMRRERRFKWLHTILVDKYGFDWFNEHVIVPLREGFGRRLVAGRR